MEERKRLLMVTVFRPDRSGITATLTGVLVRHGAEVVDIEQASIGKSRMKNILHFLGITEEDVTEALSCQA
jgi:predicted amino acid-binding ACT domain protein